jgi:hypothetical protein
MFCYNQQLLGNTFFSKTLCFPKAGIAADLIGPKFDWDFTIVKRTIFQTMMWSIKRDATMKANITTVKPIKEKNCRATSC